MIKKIFLTLITFFTINCFSLEPLDCYSDLRNINTEVAAFINNICHTYMFDRNTIFIPENYNETIYNSSAPDALVAGNFFIFNTETNKILIPFNSIYRLSAIMGKSLNAFSSMLYSADAQEAPKRAWSEYIDPPYLFSSNAKDINSYFADFSNDFSNKEEHELLHIIIAMVTTFFATLLAMALIYFMVGRYKRRKNPYSKI